MTRVVVVGDLMTGSIARACHPRARGGAAPVAVATYGRGSGAAVAAWVAVAGTDPGLIGRGGPDITALTREMELMGYGIDAHMGAGAARTTGACVVRITHR